MWILKTVKTEILTITGRCCELQKCHSVRVLRQWKLRGFYGFQEERWSTFRKSI